MAKKYLLIGFGAVIFIFLLTVGFLFILYTQQKAIMKNGQPSDVSDTNEDSFIDWITKKRSFAEEKPSSNKQLNLDLASDVDPDVSFTSSEKGAENYSMYYVKRGTLISLDMERGRLKIQDQYNPNTQLSFDVTTVNDVYCWPSKVSNPDGTVLDLQDAFIPFPPFKDLTWTNQTIKKWESVVKDLHPGRYLFIRLNEPYNQPKDNDSVLEAEQVVVLDC